MEYDLLPSKIWIRLKKCKNENDDWWKMASWPPWANEAWDRQRRADGQGGSWVGGYIFPNLGYISLNMDIYFNCECLSFNHGNLSLKRECISLHFIYSSRNIGYISLNCKCNHLNYGHSGYLISDLLLNCRYFSSSFEYISLHALFYQCTSLRSEFDLVYFLKKLSLLFFYLQKGIIRHIYTEGWVRIGLGTIWKIQ